MPVSSIFAWCSLQNFAGLFAQLWQNHSKVKTSELLKTTKAMQASRVAATVTQLYSAVWIRSLSRLNGVMSSIIYPTLVKEHTVCIVTRLHHGHISLRTPSFSFKYNSHELWSVFFSKFKTTKTKRNIKGNYQMCKIPAPCSCNFQWQSRVCSNCEWTITAANLWMYGWQCMHLLNTDLYCKIMFMSM